MHMQTHIVSCLPIYVPKCIHPYMLYTYIHLCIHSSITTYVCNMYIYVHTYRHICPFISAYIHVYMSHRDGFSDNKVFCSCSGHLSLDYRGKYQLDFPWSLFDNSDLKKMVIQFTPYMIK